MSTLYIIHTLLRAGHLHIIVRTFQNALILSLHVAAACWQYSGEKKSPSSSSSSSPFLFCSSSDNCLKQKMSCRHLAPRGRKACYSPPNTHAHTHTLRVWASVCDRGECVAVCACMLLHSYSACLCVYMCVAQCVCAALLLCACELVLSVNLPLVPACSGWFYWSNRQRGHTHTPARSSPDPRLIETDRDLVKLREQPGVVCRPRGIRPRVTKKLE